MTTIKDSRFVSTMFPLVATDGSVGFDSIQRDEVRKLINSHLKMLLLTNPGELISDPSFGVGLYQILFLNEMEDRVRNLKQDITTQISEYLEYLKTFRVDVDYSKLDTHTIGIQVRYKIDNELEVTATSFIASEGSITIYEHAEPASASGPASVVPMTLGQILAERS